MGPKYYIISEQVEITHEPKNYTSEEIAVKAMRDWVMEDPETHVADATNHWGKGYWYRLYTATGKVQIAKYQGECSMIMDMDKFKFPHSKFK